MKRTTHDTEAGVQAEVRRLLHSKGVKTQKIPGSTLLQGFPDLFCVGRPRRSDCDRQSDPDALEAHLEGVFFIEMKAPGVKKLRWSQVAWCERFEAARIYVLSDPSKLWTTLRGPSNWRAWVPKDKRLSVVVEEWAEGS